MKWLFWGFLVLFLVALGIFFSNLMGLFGQTPDPLAGVFLLPFGLPWNLLGNGLSDPYPMIIGFGAPLVNLAILWWLWRFSKKHRRKD